MADALFDPKYEFKVPKFNDFTLIDQDDQATELDKYFEFDHENGVPVDFGFAIPAQGMVKKNKSEDGTSLRPRRSLRNTPAQEVPEKQSPRTPSTSCSVPDADVYATPVAIMNAPTPASAEPGSQPVRHTRTRSQTKSQSLEDQQSKSGKEAGNAESGMLSNICMSASEWEKKKILQRPPRAKPSPKPGLARSASMKATRTPKILSTEEQELEKIKQLREEVTRKRRIAQKSHTRALSVSSTNLPLRSNQELTKAKAFSFATDKRIPDKPVETTATEHKNFTSMLRHYQPVRTQQKGPTIPMDISLYTRKRKFIDEDSQKASIEPVPLWSKTPDRFHSKPRNSKFVPSNKRRRSRSMDCKITVPVTPKLKCKERARRVHVVSQAEIEEKLAEEVSNYRFRARPLNEKIFESNCMGVPRKEAKEPTVAVSPNFQSNKRRPKENIKDEAQKQPSFHARPIPKGILDAPQGIKEPLHKPLTHAKSPAFAFKNRGRSIDSDVSHEVDQDNNDHIIRAHLIPDLNKKFEVKIEKSIVRVEPFSFDQRDQAIPMRKQQLVKEEELKLKKARQFRARNPDVLLKPGFLPKPSSQPPTDITNHRLNTDMRSVEREKWEMKKADAERQVAQAKAEADRRRQEEEKKEIERIRRQAVHKAQPVRHFQQTVVQKSTVPPTLAHSPCFSTRLRSRAKNY